MENKFTAIASLLRERIESGAYPEGAKLPCETELARTLGTSKLTLRRALDRLASEKFIRKAPYIGTFVCRGGRKHLRIALRRDAFPGEVFEELAGRVRAFFPELELEFVTDFELEKLSSFDLINITGGTWLPYAECARPFPSGLIEPFGNGEYFENLFDVHRIDRLTYALPILFSPSLLMTGNGICDGALNWHELARIARDCRKQGATLWNHYTVERIFASLLFTGCDRSEEIDVEFFLSFMAEHAEIFHPGLISLREREFLAAGNPVNWGCRQWFSQQKLNYQVHPFPALPGIAPPRSVAAGEFLLIGAGGSFPEEAAHVAAAFLRPEIQRIIGRARLGFPVLKSAALDSMDGTVPGDAFFLEGAGKMLTNRAAEQEFYLRLNAFIHDWSAGTMTTRELGLRLRYEVDMARHKKEIRMKKGV